MRKFLIRWVILLPMMFVPFVRADDLTNVDKSEYTLLNPTPTDLMRHWYTDHAGASPYTIDAGHFEADLTALNYGYYHRSYPTYGRTSQEYSIGGTEIKAGLLNNVDIEMSIVPYTSYSDNYHDSNGEQAYRRNGVSDLTSRIKWNLWGNDGGATALSVGALFESPTGTGSIDNEHFQGGVLLNFEAHLPCGFEMRIHNNALSIADYYNGPATREFSFENEISLSHQIVGNLEGYCLFNTYSYTTPGRDWDGSVSVGLNYRFIENVELYTGMDFGVHGNTYDYSPFIGISARF